MHRSMSLKGTCLRTPAPCASTSSRRFWCTLTLSTSRLNFTVDAGYSSWYRGLCAGVVDRSTANATSNCCLIDNIIFVLNSFKPLFPKKDQPNGSNEFLSNTCQAAWQVLLRLNRHELDFLSNVANTRVVRPHCMDATPGDPRRGKGILKPVPPRQFQRCALSLVSILSTHNTQDIFLIGTRIFATYNFLEEFRLGKRKISPDVLAELCSDPLASSSVAFSPIPVTALESNYLCSSLAT